MIALCTPVYMGLTVGYVESLAGNDPSVYLPPIFQMGCLVQANRVRLVQKAKEAKASGIVWADCDVSWHSTDIKMLSNTHHIYQHIRSTRVRSDDGQVYSHSLAFCYTPIECFTDDLYPWFAVTIGSTPPYVEGEDAYFFRTQQAAGMQVEVVELPTVKHKGLSL